MCGDSFDTFCWRPDFCRRPARVFAQSDIQTELIYDYRTNIDSYPRWQRWLRSHAPPVLVIWGRHDLSFTVPGAWAFRRDLPAAQIEILDGGHFVMDTRLDEVARLTARFLESHRNDL